MTTTLHFSQYLSNPYYVALGMAMVVLLALFFFHKREQILWWRILLIGVVLFFFLGPVTLHEVREDLPNKVLIVVDKSASQSIGNRDETAENILKTLTEKIKKEKGLETIVVEALPKAGDGKGTYLFQSIQNNIAQIPLQQIGGTVLITDGQVHDVPADGLAGFEKFFPIHTVLTGKRDEFDHKITIISAPKYSVLNEGIQIDVKVDVVGKNASQAPVALTVYQDGEYFGDVELKPSEPTQFTFNLKHAGQNVFEFKTAVVDGELTDMNNNAPVIVNGIRDRLRVLLVSGAPHMGERAWRNLLKSDPSIDLVHFTILRSPNSMDRTPQNELSLIVFPVDELFQKKINDFDLIILDRYKQYDLLMPQYFNNISSFVKNGGALLMAMGTNDTQTANVFGTSIGDLLPVAVSGTQTISQIPYAPELTDVGKAHPVTADLSRMYEGKQWGQWYTQFKMHKRRGEILMTGVNDTPLLVLDTVGEGRVAVLTSDNMWLWAKGGADHGGPYTELLRNVSHWLMKEPELEEDFIKADVRGKTIFVQKRHDVSETAVPSITMTDPMGEKKEISLTEKKEGWHTASVAVKDNGIYRLSSGERSTFVVVGTAANKEFLNVETTEDILKPVADQTKGHVFWSDDMAALSLEMVSPSARRKSGSDWMGFRENDSYHVTEIEARDIVHYSLALLLILLAFFGVWWRESKA